MKNHCTLLLERKFLLFKFSLAIILLTLSPVFLAAQTIQYYQTGEEFAGPFPSWKNVKTDFGAIGDGITDDTQAIQAALNALKNVNTNNWSVLYFPAGTYRISSTLTTVRVDHNDYLGISIVGEDPATTVLSWNGAPGRDMFSLDAWYAKVGRLTFDGKGTANTGLLRDGGFSTFCELNDLFFKDMSVGISLGGSSGEGQAEHAIERCRFSRCSYAGVTTNNFNVIDVYVWYSLFEDCARGISNGAGSYNAVGNVFLRSTVADLNSDNSLTFVILNNTSINSETFMRFPAGLAHVQGNKIYNTLDPVAITASNPYGGVPSLIGNLIRSRSGNSGAAVTAPYGNHLFVDNTFTVSNPVEPGGRIFNAKQQIVAAATVVVPTVLQLPGTPQNRNRNIFEVRLGTGNDANEIQQKINAAAAQPDSTNPIVHIPKGNFSINSTILVPAKSIQIVGDGGNENATVIGWGGSGSGPGFRLLGPSRVTMRDMMLGFGGAYGADAMVIENSDQVGGHIFCDQVLCNGNSSNDKCYTSVLVDGVENSDVTYVNGAWGEYTNAGVLVKGGTALSTGGTTNGQVALMFGGLGNNENKIMDVENGGRVLAYGFRDETPDAGNILNLGATTGSVSIAGMSWAATPSSTVPFININGFKGTLAYVGNGIGTGYGETPGSLFMKITGDGSNGKILSAANVFGTRQSTTVQGVWQDNTIPKANATLLNCSGAAVNEELQNIPNVVNQIANAQVDTNFVLNTLSQIRNFRLSPLTARAAGLTDVRLIRLFMRVGNGRTGLTLKGDGGSSGNVSVTSVSVSPISDTININATLQLTATVSPGNASNPSVTWTSSDTAIASVSSSGMVTSVAFGTATITVTTVDGNKSATSAITVTTITTSPHGVLTSQIPTGNYTDGPYELGMKFTSTQAGNITKIRYYKVTGESGTHTGRIWTSGGTQIAGVAFTNETASGWQQATLAAALSITANTTYIVSVNSNAAYGATNQGLQSVIKNNSLSSIADGANGVYGNPGTFPANSFQNSNYFRDVIFKAATTIYTFIGTGNWTNAANWTNNSIPPAILSAGEAIIINPSGVCVLNTNQTIPVGTKLTIVNGKKLIIPGNLDIK